jgi:hypothetical protein
MSTLSKLSGIHISKHGVHIDPKQVLKAGLLTAGGLGAVGIAGLGGLGAGGMSSGLSGLGKLGAIKKVAGLVSGGGDPTQGGRFRNLLDLGKFGEGVYDTYQQNRQYNDAKNAYNEAAPLREAGMKGLLDTSTPDLSSTFADPMNPQGRYRRVTVGSRGGY